MQSGRLHCFALNLTLIYSSAPAVMLNGRDFMKTTYTRSYIQSEREKEDMPARWLTPGIPPIKMLRQEDCKSQVNPDSIVSYRLQKETLLVSREKQTNKQ